MPTLHRDGDVFVLDLGGDENLFNAGSLDAIESSLEEIERGAPCALVTSASGKVWCNGLDLPWLGTQGEQAGAFILRVHELLARVLELGVPTVAAIQGHAFGAGAMLALAHDARVMRADRGFFCLPEVDLRMPFTSGMSALVSARLPICAAHEAMTTGRRYGGGDAHGAGIMDSAVGEEQVLPTALQLASARNGKDFATLQTIKQRLYERTLAALRGPQGF
jgi:Delta3-Delta2-enoyl-CoA isomerase